MPSADVILQNLTDIANRWRLVAMSWHAVLALGAVALISGWRPSQRAAGGFLVAPVASVAIIAALGGNPFNAIAFAVLAAQLAWTASRLPSRKVQIAPSPWAVAGVVLMTFGLIYPHFLQTTHWTEYAYAAPLGLVPCPTLAFVVGASLLVQLSKSAWTLPLGVAGLLYGVVGTFGLGVGLDYGLLAGAIALLARWAHLHARGLRALPARPATKHIAIIQGHPDPTPHHFCHALAEAYAAGALQAGHDVSVINVGALDFPLVRSRDDLEHAVPASIRHIQDRLLGANHVVMIFPLWNGSMPAVVKGFLEQTFRPSFIFPDARRGQRLGFLSYFSQRKALAGRTARLIETMAMPGWLYRWYFHPHPEKNTLRLSGLKVRETLVGLIDTQRARADRRRRRWLARMEALGRAGA